MSAVLEFIVSTGGLLIASIIMLIVAVFTFWKAWKQIQQSELRIFDESTAERIRFRLDSYTDLMKKLDMFSATKIKSISKKKQKLKVRQLIEVLQAAIFGQFGLLASHETRETALRFRAHAMEYLNNKKTIDEVLVAGYKLHQMMRSDMGVTQPFLRSSIEKLRSNHNVRVGKDEIENLLREDVKHVNWHGLVPASNLEETGIELIIFDCDYKLLGHP